jgi:hypothetical protein
MMSNGRKDFSLTSLAWDLLITNRRWRYDDFNNSGRHVIDEAGDEPVARQCRNRPERSDVDYNRGARIPDRFGLEFRFLDLKIARQKCRVASEARDAAIGVLKYDEVKLPAASRKSLRQPDRFVRVDPTAPTTLGLFARRCSA